MNQNQMLNNELTHILQIDYPIIQGGLAYVANGALAAAVSNAGGFGQVGASGRSPEEFRAQIQIAKSKTDRPFGVNIPVSRYTDNEPYIQVALEEAGQVTAVSLSAGDPRPYIDRLKAVGLKVMLVVATVRQATRAEQSGADVVICEGFEAGGHDGPNELTVFTLVPQVAALVKIPVVLAGGVATGRQIVAAMSLGAQGVQMGTRFVATEECQAHQNYKEQIVRAGDDGTTVIERGLNVSTRVLKNEYVNHIRTLEASGAPTEEIRSLTKGEFNQIAAIAGDVEAGYMYAGQSAGMITSVLPAKTVIDQLVDETHEAIASLPWANTRQI